MLYLLQRRFGRRDSAKRLRLLSWIHLFTLKDLLPKILLMLLNAHKPLLINCFLWPSFIEDTANAYIENGRTSLGGVIVVHPQQQEGESLLLFEVNAAASIARLWITLSNLL